MTEALRRIHACKATVIPIILRPCDWTDFRACWGILRTDFQ
ncbi:MAG: hypothetical protein AAGI23_20550 [Bacteroidota bacterium]